MQVFDADHETLPLTIAKDDSTGLPLLSEEDNIFELILTYLALPYSVAEYGCGKKASMLLAYLLSLGIPPYAVARGLVMERDMSPEAIAEFDPRRRRNALVLANPLYSLGDLGDPHLRAVLHEACPDIEIDDREIRAAGFILHHEPSVQFAIARTHIFTVLTFWDEVHGRAVRRVIDPTQNRNGCFPVSRVREFLSAPNALIFRAPLLGRFRLDSRELSVEQFRSIVNILGDEESASLVGALAPEAHVRLVRELSGAAAGSPGDPATWTYANNISTEQLGHDQAHRQDEARKRRTGRGDTFYELTERLLAGREACSGEVPVVLAELKQLIQQSRVEWVVQQDAIWAEAALEPLANIAVAMAYYNSLTQIARMLKNGDALTDVLRDRKELSLVRGVGVRLRRRIDRAGTLSRAVDGRIDARALTPGFARATIETIRDMHRAGLSVAVDRVGNLHGIVLSRDEAGAIRSGAARPRDFMDNCLLFGSHIDTVYDAGKFDGRLGVLSGVETAHVLRDLERYCGVPALSGKRESRGGPRIAVSAFIGEEMSFTGQGVSMPGSAAVSGRASVQEVYAMTNGDGEAWGDVFPELLRQIAAAERQGDFELLNRFSDEGDLIAACFEPTDFYSPHSYERHIEQGPILDRHTVSMALVDVVMGIYQEDFLLRGERAEAAALEMNVRLREIALEMLAAGEDVRVAAGIFEGITGEDSERETRGAETFANTGAAEPPLEIQNGAGLVMRLTLEGEMNHAGATPTHDRRDPGVAAGRLCREFTATVARIASRTGRSYRPLIGNLRTTPGTNRNVIPGAVSLSLGVVPPLDSEAREELLHRLQGLASGELAKPVGRGGEGLQHSRMHAESFLRPSGAAVLSIDLRSAFATSTQAYLERVRALLPELEREFGVSIARQIQQHMEPSPLEASGQVLLIERSYGGSHNPRETEMLNDLVRGSVLQLAVAREVLAMQDGLPADFYLFRLVESKLPQPWLRKLARFTSGALHDSCNLAAAHARNQARSKR